jgi:glycosyltransferase involved in cell wall biosynthesis
MSKEKKSIAFVLYTSGLEYDDRVRKEALSLSAYANVEVFFITPENNSGEGVTSYGVPYRMFSLKSRRLLPSGKYTFIKSFDFFLTVRKHLKRFDVVWVHDVHVAAIPFFLSHKNIVWDLHEIPAAIINNQLTRQIFKRIESKCRVVIHANPHRINYLNKAGVIRDKHKHKHVFLRNYPDSVFLTSKLVDEKFYDFKGWLNKSEYVYLQGLQGIHRFPEQTIAAIMQTNGIKAVVIGGFDPAIKEKLHREYGDILYAKIYFRGMLPQLKITRYIEDSLFSMVFYNNNTPNNRLCEPNRMYQAIASGKPVIVGSNEPMKEIVEKYGFGIVLNGFGNEIGEIISAMERMKTNYNHYQSNIELHRHEIMWSSQEPMFLEILSRLK